MIRIASFILIMLAAGWGLFLRRPALKKTLDPLRWLILAWVALFTITAITPIHFASYTVTIGTVLYCLCWLAAFALGQAVGRRVSPHRFKRQQPLSPIVNVAMLGIGTVGCLVLVYMNLDLIGEVARNPFAVALRRDYFVSDEGNIVITIATFCALGSIIPATVELIDAIACQRRIRFVAYLGFVQYAFVYVISAGRQGFAILLGTATIAGIATLQMRRFRYRHWKGAAVVAVALGAAGISYNAFILAYRSTGMTGSVEWKMDYQNTLYDATVESGFRNSVFKLGPLSPFVVEFIYYMSPQLYGLDYTLKTYTDGPVWGVVEFPYIARRVETAIGKHDIITKVDASYEKMYDSQGLFGHFFRTAVENTFLDFGLWIALVFVFCCGLISGTVLNATLLFPSAERICLCAMVCTGAAFTVIFSPFAEVGYAFPLIWFAVRSMVRFGRSTATPQQ